VIYQHVRKNKDYATINEKYHGINCIEQAEDGGLSISYVYKAIDSISSQPAFIHMPGHIPFRNGLNSATDQNIYMLQNYAVQRQLPLDSKKNSTSNPAQNRRGKGVGKKVHQNPKVQTQPGPPPPASQNKKIHD